MPCETYEERLIARLESEPAHGAEQALDEHLATCDSCRGWLTASRSIRDRLVASAGAQNSPALEGRIMAAVGELAASPRPAGRRDRWFSGLSAVRRPWRWGIAAASFAGVLLLLLLAWPPATTQAWSIDQSIEAGRPFGALHLEGSIGGARCELWARSSADRSRSQRVLIRLDDGTTIWTEGNATYVLDPRTRTVYTEDAITAGFDPWPSAKLLELAKSAGVRTVETRWRFPARRTAVAEWSLVSSRGPMSAVAEFDLESKRLVSLRQWDNADRRGAPGFEADDITYLQDLPDAAFSVAVPQGAVYRPRDVEVAESVLGLLALPDAGMPAGDLSLGEAARRAVMEMWNALLARDITGFRRLCPVTRGWTDQFLLALLGSDSDPDAVVEVVGVDPGVPRGHSRLGPVSVVSSRVRHRDGGLYEQKIVVQHRLSGTDASCVIYSNYGQPYRLE